MSLLDLILQGKNGDAKESFCEMIERKILEVIEARQVKIRITSTGKRTRRIVCGPGKKLVDGRCVIQSGQEKLARKKAARVASRKRKAHQAQATRKRVKALKKRKSQGL